jgi:hypothetical protein
VVTTSFGGGPWRRARILYSDQDKRIAVVGIPEKDGSVTRKAVPFDAMRRSKQQGKIGTPKQQEELQGDIPGAAAMIDDVEAAIAAGGPIPTKIGSHSVHVMNSEDDVMRALAKMGDETQDFAEARGGTLKKKQSGEYQLTESWEDTIVAADREYKNANWALGREAHAAINERQMIKLMQYQDEAGKIFMEAHRRARGPNATAQDKADAIAALAKLRMFVDIAQGARTTAGRTLNILKNYQTKASDETQAAVQFLKKLGGEEHVDLTLRLLEDLTPGQMMAAAPKLLEATTSQKLLEAWKMGLLSGPTTHAVNSISNKLFKSLDTAEHAVAGLIGKLHGGDKVYMREAPARMTAGIKAFRQALKVAQKAFKLEQEGFALGKVEAGHAHAIGGKLGKIVRTPGRLLVAEDEFFKTFAYAAEMQSQAIRKVMRRKDIPKHRRQEAIDALVQKPEKDMIKAAEDAAHRLTFTNDLGKSGKRIQKAIQDTTGLGFIVPFFRTPVNIAKQAIYRTPGAAATPHFWRQVLKEKGAARDLALARVFTGTTLGSFAGALVMDDRLSGAGPAEPGRLQAKYPTWQPYSVRFGDRWISYNRIEPVGMVLGMFADAAELWRDRKDYEANELYTRALTVASKNLASKTFIKGVADFALAATAPDRGAEALGESLARSMVPASALMGQTARLIDPHRREVDNPLQAMQSQIPFARNLLEPGRTVTGEVAEIESWPVNIGSPFYSKEVSQDPVAQELGMLADEDMITMGKPSRKMEMTTSLAGPKEEFRVSPEEWQILWGDANRRAAERLRPIVSAEGYQDMPLKTRATMVKRVYERERRNSANMIRMMRMEWGGER